MTQIWRKKKKKGCWLVDLHVRQKPELSLCLVWFPFGRADSPSATNYSWYSPRVGKVSPQWLPSVGEHPKFAHPKPWSPSGSNSIPGRTPWSWTDWRGASWRYQEGIPGMLLDMTNGVEALFSWTPYRETWLVHPMAQPANQNHPRGVLVSLSNQIQKIIHSPLHGLC